MSEYFDFIAQPKVAWITVNRECNFRCSWCYAENTGYKSTDDMPLMLAKDIVDAVFEIGVENIVLTGGEPTMWGDLFNLVDYIKQKKINLGIITNASLYGDDRFWEAYQEHSCDSVRISIKGVTEQQMSKIARVGNLCDNTLLGAKRALEFHSIADIGTVYSSLTSADDIKKIAEVSKKLGATSFSLAICLPTISEK